MDILVTGGAGYIGSHFVLALLDAGHQPVVVDDLSSGRMAAVPAHVPFFRGDAGDPALLREIFSKTSVEAVVHFAGSIVVADSVSDPLAYYANNTSAARTLIAECVRAGIGRFVFSSTAAVYGSVTTSSVSEGDRTAPVSPYGRSKLVTEWMLEDARVAHGLRYAAIRYFNVAGADPYMRTGQCGNKTTHLIKAAAEAALGLRGGLDVFGTDYPTSDGTCVRDYVHVSDLAAAHLDALRWLQADGHGIFNCGYGAGHSVMEVVDAVRRISGSDFEVRFQERRPGDPAVIVSNPSRARRLLGWSPKYADLDVIVGHALEWERRLASEKRAPAVPA